jgi:hypothetical protein
MTNKKTITIESKLVREHYLEIRKKLGNPDKLFVSVGNDGDYVESIISDTNVGNKLYSEINGNKVTHEWGWIS